MANRRLYNARSFIIEKVLELETFDNIWHLHGRFVGGSIVSKHDRDYYVRVKADVRWRGIHQVSFHDDSVWESESVYRETRRHIYGSGKWYLSPHRPRDSFYSEIVKEAFDFDDFEVVE